MIGNLNVLALVALMYPSYLHSLAFSTFETIDKKKEKKLKKLKLKLDLAKFVQESMVSGITLQKGKPKELEKFAEFIAKVSILDITPSIYDLFTDYR